MSELPPPAALTPGELAEHFPVRREELASPDDAPLFEIGLALGGTVSAGAYTAGVLDMLIEALDAWTAAKERGEDVPKHAAVISVVGGASGGAVNGAILLRAANYARPPLDATDPTYGRPLNPFLAGWIGNVTLQKLLDVPRETPGGVDSLLDTRVIESTVRELLLWQGQPLGSAGGPRQRSYFATPLRLIMMLTNVTGVPFGINYRTTTALGHSMLAHDDAIRFALDIPGGIADRLPVRLDEIAVASGVQETWERFVGPAVLGTMAFPLAFPARPFQRPWDTLRNRAMVIPSATAGVPPRVEPLVPTWNTLREALLDQTTTYRTVNVDGGAVNNEPIEHVRRALAGWASRNERGPAARRAVVLIDPFSEAEGLGPLRVQGALKMAFPLVWALVQQSRYKPEDIALATADDVNSRFLVAPWRMAALAGASGSKALACGGLGGFLGFVDTRFMRHDFELGRWNAWHFLRTEFVLEEKDDGGAINSLFADPWWTAAQRDRHRHQDGYLPIIPLVGPLYDAAPPAPRFEALKLDEVPAWLSDAVEDRLEYLYSAVRAELNLASGWKGRLFGLIANPLWWGTLRGGLRDRIVDTLATSLRDNDLLKR